MEAHTRGLTTCIDTTGALRCAALPAAAKKCRQRCGAMRCDAMHSLAGQGMKAHHWDKVLPHLDYALFCIKSPIPGAVPARCGDGGLPPLWVGGVEDAAGLPRFFLITLMPCPRARPPCSGRREVRAHHQAPYRAGAGVCCGAGGAQDTLLGEGGWGLSGSGQPRLSQQAQSCRSAEY